MHNTKMSSSGDCVLVLALLHHKMERESALTDGSADCFENTQCAPST
jgi:hypothetical protein